LLRDLYNDQRDLEILQIISGIPNRERSAELWLMCAAVQERAGELREAIASLNSALQLNPASTSRLLDRVRLLLRLGDRDAAARDLVPLPKVSSGTQEMELAYLLDEVGRREEAIELAYRALHHAADSPDVHRGYIGLLLMRGQEERDHYAGITKIGVDVAFALQIGSRTEVYVIDPEASEGHESDLRPTSLLSQRAMGHEVGDQLFVHDSPYGQTLGTVIWIKHRYLHALHESMARFNRRFPDEHGLLQVDVGSPEDAKQLLTRITADRAKRIQELEAFYSDGPVPVALLAHILKIHVSEVAAGLNSERGPRVRSCVGTAEEREQAIAILRGSHGLLLDGLTAFNAFNLNVQTPLMQTFGRLGITQATIDSLNALIAEREMGRGGYSVVVSEHGEPVQIVVSAEQVEQSITHLVAMRDWMANDCEVVPARGRTHPSDPLLRDLLRRAGEEVPAVLAALSYSGRTLLSDDMNLRTIALRGWNIPGAWLQPALWVSMDQGHLPEELYQEAVLQIARAGYKFTSVDDAMILKLAEETNYGQSPRWLGVLQCLSGSTVELSSSLAIAGHVIIRVWSSEITIWQKERVAGTLLNAILEGHWADTVRVIATLLIVAREYSWRGEFLHFLRRWCQGHFVPSP
jgi:cellulose synthase operon protein C